MIRAYGSPLFADLDAAEPSPSFGRVGATSLPDLDRMRGLVVHLLDAPLSQLLVGHGLPRFCQVAGMSPEDEATVARVATVESEGELVERGVQLLVTHRPLVGSEQPALQ